MKWIVFAGSVGVAFSFAIAAKKPAPGVAWMGYGGNSQHAAQSATPSSPLKKIIWKVSLDDQRSYYGNVLYVHYASPAITASNTVVHAYRFTTTVGGNSNYDNWRVYGRSGVNGAAIWKLPTDYSAPVLFPSGWTTVYPMTLTGYNTVAAAGGGGTVLFRDNADSKFASTKRVSFYSQQANYEEKPSDFASIKICTPLTGTTAGDVYFGYLVDGSVPGTLSNVIGTGGVVRISANGSTTFRKVSSLGIDPNLARPALSAAPALSSDGTSVYFAFTNDGQNSCYLAKLDASTLAPLASALLIDPSNGGHARAIDESSAAPMVAPDGHVFYGVYGNLQRESHGWMLQFDGDLNPNDSQGHRWPAGAFGWDDTPSVVPANIVPSYTGGASYLLLSKYNNYAFGSGDGVNRVAVLDPTSDSTTTDRQSGIPVMNEVLTIQDSTPDQEGINNGHPDAVREWCINSAAIDVPSKSAIVNCEDGNCYRWDFTTNTLSEKLLLAPPTGEAYTSTAIGSNGNSYAINNAQLFVMGTPINYGVANPFRPKAAQPPRR